MIYHGALRIKNEARWIERVLRSIQPLCERIHVLDNNSTDGTAEICEAIEGVTVYRNTSTIVDESEEKDMLLQAVIESVPSSDLHEYSPHHVVAIDGDEILAPGGQEKIRKACEQEGAWSWSLPVLYLWDSEDRRRVDGVYANFQRPSVFRLINAGFRYQRTPFGSNFHCASVPQELLHGARFCDAPLLHLGYLHKEDRLRKYQWYNERDPENATEDGYRHICQGDLPEVPVDMKLRHAGPLRLMPLLRGS